MKFEFLFLANKIKLKLFNLKNFNFIKSKNIQNKL